MRILTIGNFGTGWDGSICDEEHIAKALEELGDVDRLQREELDGFVKQYTAVTERKDWWLYDFILIAQWDGFNIESIKGLKALGNGPLVYWAFDYQADGQEWHERLVAESDLYLSKRIADSKYPNWQWLSQDFAPSFLDKYPLPIKKDIDVLFTGSYLPWATERNETLKAVDEKFNLVIHSVNAWDGFKDVRPPIMDEGLPELYARANVVLSIDHTIETGYWSDRNAQIMCCDVRPLFRYVPMSEHTFHDYVDYFYSVEDCLNKIQWGLKQDDRHYKYAQSNLKVNNRVQDLLTIVRNIL